MLYLIKRNVEKGKKRYYAEMITSATAIKMGFEFDPDEEGVVDYKSHPFAELYQTKNSENVFFYLESLNRVEKKKEFDKWLMEGIKRTEEKRMSNSNEIKSCL